MLSTRQQWPIGYFILTLLGVCLIQPVFFVPQSEICPPVISRRS